jgi:cation:H+ antiporter
VVIELILFLIGIPLLWKGATLLIDGGATIARHARVPPFLIGLTVVSIGTSAPEFVVNVLAAARGETDLALATILGSNIANTTLILGAAALIGTIRVGEGTFRTGIPFTALITLAAFVLLNDAWRGTGTTPQLGRIDGLILVALFAGFLWVAAARRSLPVETPPRDTDMSLRRAITYTAIGVAGLGLGGQFLLLGALALTQALGVTTSFVGFAFVAIGTSLPELAASIAGSWKKEFQLVVGTIIGSNIFNLLWILGVTALVRPIPRGADANILVYGTLGAALLLWALLVRRRRLTRTSGAVLVAAYALYLGLMTGRAF